MTQVRDIDEVLSHTPQISLSRLKAPSYVGDSGEKKVMLAVEAMSRHTADAGWQLQIGLESAGYELWGKDFTRNETNVTRIIEESNPDVVIVQDKREWEGRTARQNDHMRFTNIESLRVRNDIFKLTVLKDAQQHPRYHRESAQEIAVHGWIIYYHPRIVSHVSTYVRPAHCIRTYHSINVDYAPDYLSNRPGGCLLSGAKSNAYPLRSRLITACQDLPNTDYLPHPGYQANRCYTPKYLEKLSQYKVAICTSSRFGYALRKIIEATACGCRVITDLPSDEVLPEIDQNLVRIPNDIIPKQLGELLRSLYNSYDPSRQESLAQAARRFYDYRAVTARLAQDIEALRTRYAC